ncbi:MAG: hypothetical protein ACFFG0_19900, partial [Candidatus Thorarchaeota archaeon]
FDGVIDELHISDTLRDPESFNISYSNQNDPKSFYNISQEVAFNIDPPVFSNLTESSNIIELGDIETITINTTALSGIRQVLIEFEGSNHSMINIDGDLWQYDNWVPSQIGNYTYIIFIEDNTNNWNSLSDSIMVIDTTPPTKPIMISAPSIGAYNTLVFDWADGFDLSGISIYNLIIDNESDPYLTPGFMVNINITNKGSNSSYNEMSNNFIPGTYFYFLYQIDGVGLKSNYTTGSFEIIPVYNGRNNITFLDLLPYLLAIGVGSVIVLIVLRKRIQKKIHPPRKKIPLKLFISHINKISSISSALKTEEKKMILDEKIPHKKGTIKEEEIENKINEIKILADNLFNEGAYLEAKKQFKLASQLLLKLNNTEEAAFYSNLITDIDKLCGKRETLLEKLEQEKLKNNFSNYFDIYFEIIEISRKLKDFDMVKMCQSELIQLLKDEKLKISDLENERKIFEKKAENSIKQDNFEDAVKFYENCEEISLILLQLERVEENYNIDKFRDKKNDCLKKVSEKKGENKS